MRTSFEFMHNIAMMFSNILSSILYCICVNMPIECKGSPKHRTKIQWPNWDTDIEHLHAPSKYPMQKNSPEAQLSSNRQPMRKSLAIHVPARKERRNKTKKASRQLKYSTIQKKDRTEIIDNELAGNKSVR
jgi:hypothetical protein